MTRADAPHVRLRSLDAFRGLAIAGMILVNNPGSWRDAWPILKHAPWHGCTLADLVFPAFLLAVGISVTLSVGRRLAGGASRGGILLQALRRSAILFAIGVSLGALPELSLATLRIPGVLQRIAVCYLAAVVIFLLTGWRGQLGITAGLLLGYWALLTLVPVPGFGAGVLSAEGNLAAYVDSKLLAGHMWATSRTWDPEGVLSTLPALASTLLGVLTGHWVACAPSPARAARGVLLGGAAATVLGGVWALVFPLNKSLWTSSYALWTGGISLLALGALLWLVDARGLDRWVKPLEVLGCNALAAFVLSGGMTRAMSLIRLTGADGHAVDLKTTLYRAVFVPLAPPALASFLWSAAYLLLWLGVTSLLYRKRLFIKL
jgi:predicted acyltransferase